MDRNLTLHLIFHPLRRCLVSFIIRQAHRHLYLTVYTLLPILAYISYAS